MGGANSNVCSLVHHFPRDPKLLLKCWLTLWAALAVVIVMPCRIIAACVCLFVCEIRKTVDRVSKSYNNSVGPALAISHTHNLTYIALYC